MPSPLAVRPARSPHLEAPQGNRRAGEGRKCLTLAGREAARPGVRGERLPSGTEPRSCPQHTKPTGITTLGFSTVRRRRPQHGLGSAGRRSLKSRSEGTRAECGLGARAGLGGGSQVPAAVTRLSARLLASACSALTVPRRKPCQGQMRRWPSQDSLRGLGPQGPIPSAQCGVARDMAGAAPEPRPGRAG